jgi:hypothetical protein
MTLTYYKVLRLLPRNKIIPLCYLTIRNPLTDIWRSSGTFQSLVGLLALCNDPVTFTSISSGIMPSCPPSLKAVLLPACFHRFPS